MTNDIGQTFLMIAGIICLAIFAMWAIWYLERFRGGSAAKPGSQKR
jgi:hypothetical protein